MGYHRRATKKSKGKGKVQKRTKHDSYSKDNTEKQVVSQLFRRSRSWYFRTPRTVTVKMMAIYHPRPNVLSSLKISLHSKSKFL
jgi:hypothetical protein